MTMNIVSMELVKLSGPRLKSFSAARLTCGFSIAGKIWNPGPIVPPRSSALGAAAHRPVVVFIALVVVPVARRATGLAALRGC